MADADKIICEICKKSFSQKQTLKRHHLEIHKDIPLPANFNDLNSTKQDCQYCSKLISKQNMKKHLEGCKAKKDEQAESTSTKQHRRREIDVIYDPFEMDESLFGIQKPLKAMLREYLSKEKKHQSKSKIDQHIKALSKYEESFSKKVILTPKFLTETVKTEKFNDYVFNLESVSERSAILQAFQASFKMLKERDDIRYIPKLNFDDNNVIQEYLDSDLRNGFFNALEKQSPEHFAQNFDYMTTRHILLVETLLATKSGNFVKKLTRDIYLNGSMDVNNRNQPIYIFELDSEKIEIPETLRKGLHKYFVIMRRHNLPLRKILDTEGKVEIYDPSKDPQVKFFAISVMGRPPQVEIEQKHFEFFHKASKAHKYFTHEDFVASDVVYQTTKVYSGATCLTSSFHGRKSSASSRRVSEELPTVQENCEGSSSFEPSLEKSKKQYVLHQFTPKEIAYLKETFKDVRRTDLNRNVVLARTIMDDEFDKFINDKKEDYDFTTEKLAEEILRIFKE